ncbi:MAG: hypothetical protein V3T51_04410 [Gammaproteobacteria bacterium]
MSHVVSYTMALKDDTVRLYGLQPGNTGSSKLETDGLGHNVWTGDVETGNFELDSPVVHQKSEAQRRLAALREAGEDFGLVDIDDPLEITEEEDLGCNPYETIRRRF